MGEKLLDILDDLGWRVMRTGDDNYDIGQYSPAGEDFWFTADQRHAAQDIVDYAESFDAEEHAVMWANERLSGKVHDVPDLRTLVEDAEAIQETLLELARAVSLMEGE